MGGTMTEATTSSVSSVWRLATLPLMGSAVMVVLAAAIVAASTWWADGAQRAFQASAARLASAREGLRTSQDARAKLEVNLAKFEELSAGKFVGVPDRLALLEALEGAAALWPKGLLRWEISPQQTVRKLTDEATGSPLAEVRVIPMKLSAAHVHEVEWLGFLKALEQQRAGYFRVESCDLRKTSFTFRLRPVQTVSASCSLSWVFVVPENAAQSTK